jgi:hypothetical protein
MQPTAMSPRTARNIQYERRRNKLKLKNGILSFVTVSKFAVSQSKYNVIIILVYKYSLYLLL